MKHGMLAAALLALILLSGCIVQREGPYDVPESAYNPPPIAERDSSYTHTQSILIAGEKVGYLLTFLEVPFGSKEPQYLKPGTRLIKDLRFRTQGLITPLGETNRFVEGNQLVRVCQLTLSRNLATFFGQPDAQVVLKELSEE